MNRKLVITRYQDGIAAVLFADGKPVEIHFEREENRSILGNIYVGKVTNIVKNIQAAFIEIENRVACYYSIGDNPHPIYVSHKNTERLAVGDELLVQVSRESVKTKSPTVTSNLSLTGRYLVLTTGKKEIGVSSKLSAETRRRLLSETADILDEGFGWILRTNAAEASSDELKAEADELTGRCQKLLKIAPHRPCRSCLYQNPAQWLIHIRDLYNAEYEQILTDDADLYAQLDAYLREYLPAKQELLKLYQDRLLPLSKLYPVESAFDEALRERIWLKSGAYLVIQRTEALTVIDVNTGKCERGKAEDTFLRINLEAAGEIARQLRLRNLSGIIVVDFINMTSKTQQNIVLETLDEILKKDPVKACVVDITKLGLVEITRKRVQKSLAEKMEKTGNTA